MTWGAVGLLLLVGAVQVDLWPLTSYRLFSGVRTSARTTQQLVAEHHGGTTTVLRLDPRNPVLVTTAHQYGDLVHAGQQEREELVRAWLEASTTSTDDVTAVHLVRVRQEMDPDTLRWRDVESRTLVEVDL